MALRGMGLAATALLAFARCALAAETGNVEIENFAFHPSSLTVKAGTKIVFTNHDEVPHSVIGFRAGRLEFRSKEQMDTDESFVVLAEKPGEIEISCGLHALISGKIIVTP